MDDIILFISQEFRLYKKYKAILKQLTLNDHCLLSAQQYSETPFSVTNKFNSNTENKAFCDKEINQLIKRIEMIENWLWYLNDIERFVINGLYIDELPYERISRKWEKQESNYYTRNFWIRQKKNAFSKISDLIQKKYKINTFNNFIL